VHESARTQSKTVAREAEKQRHRQLEESWNQITRRTMPPTFEKGAQDWLALQEGRVAPNTISVARTSLKRLLAGVGSWLQCHFVPKHVAVYQHSPA